MAITNSKEVSCHCVACARLQVILENRCELVVFFYLRSQKAIHVSIVIRKTLLDSTGTLNEFHHTVILAAGQHLVTRKLEVKIYIFPKTVHKCEHINYKLVLTHIVTIFYN